MENSKNYIKFWGSLENRESDVYIGSWKYENLRCSPLNFLFLKNLFLHFYVLWIDQFWKKFVVQKLSEIFGSNEN